MFWKKEPIELSPGELELLMEIGDAQLAGKPLTLDEFGLDILDISWKHRLALKFFPGMYMKYRAREIDVKPGKIDAAMKLFDDAKRIDLFPLSPKAGRGFLIILDQKFSLWFFQEGDHFKFDGYEMGEYEKGNVTVLDK